MKKLNFKLLSFLVLVVAVVLVGCLKNEDVNIDTLSNETNVQNDEARLITYSNDVIPGQYIVVYKEGSVAQGRNLDTKTYKEKQVIMKEEVSATLSKNRISVDKVEHVYGSALKGFSTKLTDTELAKLRQDPQIDYIEQDQIITVSMGGPPGGGGGGETQETPWGISRVNGGVNTTGNTAWIIDSGIDLDHPDLNVDLARAANFASGNSANDGNGHGTHVAGTVAAKNNDFGVIGVAPGALVVPVRVLGNNGSGSTSGVIAGVDYVKASAAEDDVANMSLGGSQNGSLDAAVLSASGACKFTLAAGNESDHADNHSPGRTEGNNIYTIAAMSNPNNWASYSNYGVPPVDWIAPGSSVKSTYKGGGYATLSGTSMAAPHVCGILLLDGTISQNGTVSDPYGQSYKVASN